MMNNSIKHGLTKVPGVAMCLGVMLTTMSATAADVQYDMRIDGITCPFCVATSSKALKQIEGVKEVNAEIDKGLIKVCADESVIFTDEQLIKLFTEKGFTYRSMVKKQSCDSV